MSPSFTVSYLARGHSDFVCYARLVQQKRPTSCTSSLPHACEYEDYDIFGIFVIWLILKHTLNGMGESPHTFHCGY